MERMKNMADTIYVYMAYVNGEAHIVDWPDSRGVRRPLIYMSDKQIKRDEHLKLEMKGVADAYGVVVELREYKLVEETIEMFYPEKQGNA